MLISLYSKSKADLLQALKKHEQRKLTLTERVYFPAPAEGKIYEKLIGMDGLPIFRVYQLQQDGGMQTPAYADNNTVLALQRRIEKLEEQIGGMTNDEHIPDDADGTAGRKSNGTNATVRRTKSANE